MLKTQTDPPAISLEERIGRVHALDLGPIKFKLVHDKHDVVTQDIAEKLEERYKRFLILLLKYPNKKIVPDEEVDSFWHAHILDTRKYASDCDHIFGEFLHHFPYFGLRGKEDEKQLQTAFAETCELLFSEFGGVFSGANSAYSFCQNEAPPSIRATVCSSCVEECPQVRASVCDASTCNATVGNFARPTLASA